jgi:hypothetical protein
MAMLTFWENDLVLLLEEELLLFCKWKPFAVQCATTTKHFVWIN